MSTPKFILTADDYGPVDFINDGILHHVRKGNINSVQILTNFEQEKLNRSVDKLWNHVPPGKTVDVGLHLTLTSGLPLIKERDGMGIYEIWGDFVNETKIPRVNVDDRRRPKVIAFSKYRHFYLEYELLDEGERQIIETTIIEEFQAQKKQLIIALEKASVNNPAKPNALKLTSVSNHYDFFTLSDKFLELYLNVAGPDLAIRSPRRLANFKSKAYIASLSILTVGGPGQMNTAERNIDLFEKYQYSKNIKIKTPAYIDIGLYASLGGFSEHAIFASADSRLNRLNTAIERSTDGVKDTWENFPEGKNKIVEIVFHLGKTNEKNPDFTRRDEQGYVGINYKYYNNRMLETRMLDTIRREEKYGFQELVLDNLASWEDCSDIEFKAP